MNEAVEQHTGYSRSRRSRWIERGALAYVTVGWPAVALLAGTHWSSTTGPWCEPLLADGPPSAEAVRANNEICAEINRASYTSGVTRNGFENGIWTFASVSGLLVALTLFYFWQKRYFVSASSLGPVRSTRRERALALCVLAAALPASIAYGYYVGTTGSEFGS